MFALGELAVLAGTEVSKVLQAKKYRRFCRRKSIEGFAGAEVSVDLKSAETEEASEAFDKAGDLLNKLLNKVENNRHSLMEYNMDKIIRIENLKFCYMRETDQEQVEAIKEVNLQVEKGSFVAVIGKNGSGKSTLAKNINALLLPSGGAVYVKDFDTRDESHLWDIRQAAGMVFQNPDNQLVSSIVEDDVAFGPENLGVEPDKIRSRVDDALNAVNMYEHRKKAPHLLSGGQKQRIAIAGVVAMKPDCIIFDEPTAMLDPKGRGEVMDIINKLHDEDITVILITHFMEEAADADRIIIMEKGEAVLEGTPVEIFSEVEKIRALGLDVPVAVDLADRLRNEGIDIPKNIIRAEEMVQYLCQYK